MRDEIAQHLRVGLQNERRVFSLQKFLNRSVVFYHTIVDHGDTTITRNVRVGVLLIVPAVGCPAGVVDSAGSIDRASGDSLLQAGHTTFLLCDV